MSDSKIGLKWELSGKQASLVGTPPPEKKPTQQNKKYFKKAGTILRMTPKRDGH